MITVEQQSRIRTFLLSKNLPLDILFEIEDHFISQIEEIENADFDMVFQEVAAGWQDELRLSKPFYILGNARDGRRTKLEKSLKRQAVINELLRSFFITSITAISLIVYKLSPNKIPLRSIKDVSFAIIILCAAPLLYNLIINRIAFNKKFLHYKISFYPWRGMLAFPVAYFAFSYLKPYDWFASTNSSIFTSEFILNFALLLFAYFCLTYQGLIQIRFAKTMSSLKPKLKMI